MKEKGRCPHCGKFISGDILEKLNLQATIKKLENDLSKLQEHNKELANALLDRDDIIRENKTYERSNKLMEDELKRMRSYKEDLEHKILVYIQEIDRLKNRGFFARLFNKKC